MNSLGPHQDSYSDLFGSGDEVKVVLLGNSSVGKTSLAMRYVHDQFSENSIPTVGASYLSKTVWMDERRMRMQIWDTAGQERFRSLAPMYYRGAAAAVLLYDITNKESFEGVQTWVKELRTNLEESIILFVVGTHLDRADVRQIDESQAREYAAKINAQYFEASSRTGAGIEELFREVAKSLIPTLAPYPPTEKKLVLEKETSTCQC